jgi:hypothetical protein
MPSIADLDGDGQVEVVVEGGILDGATGALKHAFTPALDGHFVVSDLDGNGQLDVVTPDRAYHADGTLFIDTKLGGTWPAVADFDHNGVPEVVLVDTTAHTVTLWHPNPAQPDGFEVVRSAVDMNALFATNHCASGTYGFTHGGGPPVIADFNGDGTPDVGLAGGLGYVTLDGKKLLDATQVAAQTILWASGSTDCSSAQTGSSAFDFQGNGRPSVLYSDEQRFRIYDGTNGNILFETCNTSGTLMELPVVADVDGDGHADVVLVSNAYASGNAEYACDDGAHITQSGLRVYGDANGTWARTPPIWNEHAYHVTNISPDGVVPQHEPANSAQSGLDDFRQNKLPGGEHAAPDAVVSVAPVCPGPAALVATVRNLGAAPLPAGVVVGFYEGSIAGKRLGQSTTTDVLGTAEAEQVTLALVSPDSALISGSTPVVAVVDDGTPEHPSWHECTVTNDTSDAVSAKCP